MSFSDDVVIADSVPTNITYSLISLKDSESLRRSGSLALPKTLRIAHTLAKSPSGIDRHLAQLMRSEEDALTGEVHTGGVHVVITAPRKGVTDAQIQDMVVQLKNFLSSANVTKLLNGEP